jgi:predicted glycoside hydrolase/deacetylase ChbG (UPF0249 family)
MLSLRSDPKSIVLCADDYALNGAVSQGIVDLASRQRLSATSVMTLSPLWPQHAPALRELRGAIDVGLHLDWTSEFAHHAGWGQALGAVMWRSFTGGFAAERVREAMERQFDAFEKVWQAPPDHLDGHQHIQQFDGLRQVLCEVLSRRYGRSSQKPWLRISQTNQAGLKGALISWMGAKSLQDWTLVENWPVVTPLLGVYGFEGTVDDYARCMQGWLREASQLQTTALVMCHPARQAEAGDAIGNARANEFAYLSSDAFMVDLHRANVQLVRGHASNPESNLGSL